MSMKSGGICLAIGGGCRCNKIGAAGTGRLAFCCSGVKYMNSMIWGWPLLVWILKITNQTAWSVLRSPATILYLHIEHEVGPG